MAARFPTLPVHEQQCTFRLILGGGSNATVHRKIRQKSLDLDRTHLLRMALAVKKNEASDPIDVSFFSAYAVVLETNTLAYAIEEPRTKGVIHLTPALGPTIGSFSFDSEEN